MGEFDDDLKSRCIGFFNGIHYVKSDFAIKTDLTGEVKVALQTPTTNAFHFLLRTGELQQGHWSSISFVKNGVNKQPTIFYMNNSNCVSQDDGTLQAIQKIITDFSDCFPILEN